ncbi:MAG: 5'/3'-nucleotidase SurE [Treponema sp.]|jgi:5'-nucleotidase|nr:5'/3'-nucleotidase SurE [Treponema sp.]
MRILLTNDDGVTSPGLSLLAASLRETGHRVFVVAPDDERSGYSHSITFLNKPCKLAEIKKDTWSCSGTPADCVIIALLGGIGELCVVMEDGAYNMDKAPDLILSGINAGANLGTDIVYSGTAAAARQGSFLGIPSVALSLVESHAGFQWAPVIEYITEKLEDMAAFWKPGTFVNVNFPNTGKRPCALVPAFPSKRHYKDHVVRYTAPDGGVYCFAEAGKADNTIEAGSDWAEVKKNNAALSVILCEPAAVKEL